MSIKSSDVPRHLLDLAAIADPNWKLEGFTVSLGLPPRAVHPNARVHRAVEFKATRKYRDAAFAIAREALGRDDPPRWKTAVCQARFYFKQRRRRDRDNLLSWLKAAFDGLADAGIVQDDSGLTHLPVVVDIDKFKPRVEITVAGQAEKATGE